MQDHRYTVVYTKSGGRLGNQLLNYSHLLAFQLENPEFELYNLAFIPHLKEYGRTDLKLADVSQLEFDGVWKRLVSIFWGWDRIASIRDFYPINRLRHQSIHYFAKWHPRAQSIIGGEPHALFSFPGDQYAEFDLTDEANVDRLRSKELTVLAGWGVKCWPLVVKHLSTIRSRLQPGDEYRSVAESFIAPLRETYDKLVGVLIRQGDYRSWNGGRYFFESSRYKELMEAYADSFPSQRVGFVIASDQPQNETLFSDDMFTFTTGIAGGSGHYLESFTELSLCDEVLMPPSTFGLFAAILGSCPIVPLHTDVEAEGFKRVEEPIHEIQSHPVLAECIK